MAGNVFSLDTFDAPTEALGAKPKKPEQPADPKSVIDGIASRHNVPANLLIAVAEAAGSASADEIEADAQRFAAGIKAGKPIDALVSERFGDAERGKAVVSRAYDIADALYPDTNAPVPVPKAGPSVAGNAARLAGEAAVRGAGGAADYVGRSIDRAAEYVAGDAVRAITGGTGEISVGGEAIGGWGARKLRGAAEGIGAGVPEEARRKAEQALPTGEIQAPSTWKAPENFTLEGLAYVAAQGIGSLAPVVLTALVTKNPTAAAGVGGAMAGGDGRETAGQIIDQLWAEKLPDGSPRLAAESDLFRDLVAGGASPDQAYAEVRQRSQDTAGDIQAMIGGAGGGLTGALVAKGLPAALAGKTMAGNVARAVGAGSLEEGTQEAFETAGARTGVNIAAGTDLNPMEGTLEAAAAGALAGGPFGALGARRPDAANKPPAPADEPETKPILALPAPTNGGTIFAGGPSGPTQPKPAGDGSAGGQAAAPASTGAVPSSPVEGVAAEPMRPKGPIETAATLAPDMTPQPQAPGLFPDMKPGTPVQLVDPNTGEVQDSAFLGEGPGFVTVRWNGEAIDITPQEFEAARAEAKRSVEASKAKPEPKPKAVTPPTVTPQPQMQEAASAPATAQNDVPPMLAPDGTVTNDNAAGAQPNPVSGVQAGDAPAGRPALGSLGEGVVDATAAGDRNAAVDPPKPAPVAKVEPSKPQATAEGVKAGQTAKPAPMVQPENRIQPDMLGGRPVTEPEMATKERLRREWGRLLAISEAGTSSDDMELEGRAVLIRPGKVTIRAKAQGPSDLDYRLDTAGMDRDAISAAVRGALRELDRVSPIETPAKPEAPAAASQPPAADSAAPATPVATSPATDPVANAASGTGPADVGATWDAMPADHREALAKSAGWVTQKGGMNPPGRKIVARAWADQPETTRATLARFMAKADAQPATPATPATKPRQTPKQAAAERIRKLKEHFTPGNVVRAYGGTFDRVIGFDEGKDGDWSVRVQSVKRDGDNWVPNGDVRTHRTTPTEAEFARGPVMRAPAVEGQAPQTPSPEDKAASRKASIKAQLAEAMTRPAETHTTKAGKALKGYILPDATPGEAKDIDKYAFRKTGDVKAGWFVREDAVRALMAEAEAAPAPQAPQPAAAAAEAETALEDMTREQFIAAHRTRIYKVKGRRKSGIIPITIDIAQAKATDIRYPTGTFTNDADAIGHIYDSWPSAGSNLKKKDQDAAREIARANYEEKLARVESAYEAAGLDIDKAANRMAELMGRERTDGHRNWMAEMAVAANDRKTPDHFLRANKASKKAFGEMWGIALPATDAETKAMIASGRFAIDRLPAAEVEMESATSDTTAQQPAAEAEPAQTSLQSEITAAAAEADPEPTEAQIEAGNYRKGHAVWNGLNLTIENAKGSERSGTDPDGETWSVTMPAHYGYFRMTEGADGEHIDFYMGDVPESDYVLIIDQAHSDTGKFDEHKVMLGFTSRGAALDAYRAAFSDGRGNDRIGGFMETNAATTKAWLESTKEPSFDATKPVKPMDFPFKRKTPKAEQKTPEGWKGNKALALFKRAFGEPNNGLADMRDGMFPDVADYAEWIGSLSDADLDRIAPVFRSDYNPFHAATFLGNGGIAEAEAAFAAVGVKRKAAQPAPAAAKKPAGGILSILSEDKQKRADELKARLAAKARTQVSSGLDPEYITLGAELVGLYIEAGTKRFAQMLRDFAETTGLTMKQAQEPMRAAYNHVRDTMDLNGEDVSDMDDGKAVLDEVRRAMAAEREAEVSQPKDAQDAKPASAIPSLEERQTRDWWNNGIAPATRQIVLKDMGLFPGKEEYVGGRKWDDLSANQQSVIVAATAASREAKAKEIADREAEKKARTESARAEKEAKAAEQREVDLRASVGSMDDLRGGTARALVDWGSTSKYVAEAGYVGHGKFMLKQGLFPDFDALVVAKPGVITDGVAAGISRLEGQAAKAKHKIDWRFVRNVREGRSEKWKPNSVVGKITKTSVKGKETEWVEVDRLAYHFAVRNGLEITSGDDFGIMALRKDGEMVGMMASIRPIGGKDYDAMDRIATEPTAPLPQVPEVDMAVDWASMSRRDKLNLMVAAGITDADAQDAILSAGKWENIAPKDRANLAAVDSEGDGEVARGRRTALDAANKELDAATSGEPARQNPAASPTATYPDARAWAKDVIARLRDKMVRTGTFQNISLSRTRIARLTRPDEIDESLRATASGVIEFLSGNSWLAIGVNEADALAKSVGMPARFEAVPPVDRPEAMSVADQIDAAAEAQGVEISGDERGQIIARMADDENAADAVKAFVAKRGARAKPGKIEDFGEKIGGARKDVWAGFKEKMQEAEGLDVAAEPLSKSWPEPDYEKLIEGGIDPWTVGFIRAARDMIPRKPANSWKLKGWAEQVKTLRKFASDILNGKFEQDRLREKLASMPDLNRKISGRIALYDAVGHSKSLKELSFGEHTYSMLGGVRFDKNKSFWEVTKEQAATAFSNFPKVLARAETREEAIALFKAIFPSLDQGGTPKGNKGKGTKFLIYSQRGESGPKYRIGVKIGRNYIDLRTGIADVAEARRIVNEEADQLQAQLDRMRDIPNERRDENAPRIGADHRNGADVTPQQFGDAFGFRGVEFGNWVEDSRRQEDLNNAYDAMMDLAAILDLPPKAMSLNGTLGLAFGARGSGGKNPAAAHFEPGKVVINLTKRSGRGSLAHEWFHALDNYFARKREQMRGNYITDNLAPGSSPTNAGIRPEVIDAFSAVKRAIMATDLKARSQNIDKLRSDPYWGTGIEMHARAFESYVIAKLEDQGGANDYLANIVNGTMWGMMAEASGLGDSYPYLKPNEIETVRPKFDALFQTIETRETDRGIEMYSVELDAEPSIKAVASTSLRPIATEVARAMTAHGLAGKITPRLVRVLLGKSGVPIQGRYRAGEIDVRQDVADPRGVLFHEIIHALRDADLWGNDFGLFKREEWQALVKAVRADAELMARIRKAYPDLAPAKQIEEAVAEMYRDWATDRAEAGAFARVFNRIRTLFLAMGRALRGEGYVDAAVAMERIASGRVGGRGPQGPGGKRGAGSEMRAFHGTPHVFDRFSLDKIGTGEGAQVFGWGLYFAGRKAVAEYYRNALSARAGNVMSQRVEVDGKEVPWTDLSQDEKMLVAVMSDNGNDWQKAYDAIPEDFLLSAVDRYRAALLEMQRKGYDLKPHGRLFEVEIPEEGDLLDWDAPLSKQPASVRAKLKPLVDMIATMPDKNGPVNRARDAAVSGEGTGEQLYGRLTAFFKSKAYADGQALTAEMNRTGAGWTAENLARNAEIEARYQNPDRAASIALRDAGIPGHRFLDGRSRSPGDGSRNYVIYDDSRIDVVAAEMRDGLMQTAAKAKGMIGSAHWKDPGAWVSSFLTDRMTAGDGKMSILGLVPGRALFSELGRNLSSAKRFLKAKDAMDALRNEWHAKAAGVMEKWYTAGAKNAEAREDLHDLMHRSTVAGVDPSKPDTWRHALQSAAERDISENGYDGAQDWAKAVMEQVAAHKRAYAEVRRMYDALPTEFQKLYVEAKQTLTDLADDMDKAVMDNVQNAIRLSIKRAERAHRREMERIRDEGLEGDEKAEAIEKADEVLAKAKKQGGWAAKSKVAAMRKQFESNRLKGPYFPLARFGQYFVTVRNEKGEVISFARFERETQQKAHIKEMEALHPGRVTFGTLEQKGALRGQVDPRFVADVEKLLRDTGADPDLMDAVWQRYLETLPDLSVRKTKIHRKGRVGWNRDALRAFASHTMHGAHQLARLKYGLELEESLDDAFDEARRADNPNRTMALVNEMQRRKDWIMNPQGAAWSAAASSIAFVWYLGVSPAAALVNLSQTTVIGPAVMKAQFRNATVPGILSEIARATKDFTRGQGVSWKETWSAAHAPGLTADELAALEEGYRRGTIDKTQAHDLAAVAESGVEFNPLREKWMRRIGWAFHHAERVNREVTMLAAYRLARKDGMAHDQAIEAAIDATWKTHFSYANSDRPRVMQGDWEKFFLQFRQYTVNLLFRLFRDAHQSLNGASKEERAEAKTQLVGITLSMFAHAGIKGVWGYGLLMTLLGIFFPGGDDDAEKWLQDALLVEGDGTGTAAWNFAMGAVLNGVPGRVLGVDLSERIGSPNLWFRGDDRDLEGEDLLQGYVNEVLGPSVGILFSLARSGQNLAEGEVARGIEGAVPKFMRDIIRTGRYAAEGVRTKKGDIVVEDVNPLELLMQANGFTPARVAERYDINSRLKNAETRLMDERTKIQHAAGDGLRSGDGIPPDLMEKIARWNREYPEYPITADTIRQSLRSRMQASDRNEAGVALNPKLDRRLRDAEPPAMFN